MYGEFRVLGFGSLGFKPIWGQVAFYTAVPERDRCYGLVSHFVSLQGGIFNGAYDWS